MAFLKKTWKDTIAEYPNRRVLTNVSTGDTSTVTVTRSIGTVSQEGDAWNAENMNDLEDRIGNEFTQINSNFVVNEFVFTTDMWAEDSAHTYADYPYVATYVTNKYSDDYVPLNITPLPMNGAVYTEEEFSAFASTNLSCADLGTHGFRVWAKEVPEVSIKFRIMGEG